MVSCEALKSAASYTWPVDRPERAEWRKAVILALGHGRTGGTGFVAAGMSGLVPKERARRADRNFDHNRGEWPQTVVNAYSSQTRKQSRCPSNTDERERVSQGFGSPPSPPKRPRKIRSWAFTLFGLTPTLTPTRISTPAVYDSLPPVSPAPAPSGSDTPAKISSMTRTATCCMCGVTCA